MRKKNLLLIVMLTLGGPVLAQDPAAYDEARMAAACDAASNVGPDICGCVAERARADLSQDGFMFVTASYEKDDATTAVLRSRMPPTDTIAASMFMVNGAARCAGG